MTAWASPLGRRDPTVKLAVAIAISLLLVLVIDPGTTLLFLGATVAVGLAAGRVGPLPYARALLALAVVGLGFVWSNALLATSSDGAPPLATLGPLRVSEAGLRFGVAIALRGLAIGAVSVTFILTTDPTRFAVSLVRNARVPYRIAYPMLAAYRFLPLLADEYAQIHLAQRVRGAASASRVAAVRARLRELVPLFATAIRRATAVAIAMDARAFAAATQRTYWRETPVRASDLAFAIAALAGALALLSLSAALGWLRLWDGRFSA